MVVNLHLVLHLLRTHLTSNRVDIFLIGGGAAVAWAFPSLGAKEFRKFEGWFGKLAQKRGLAVLTVGLLALAGRAALLPIRPIPQPGVRDEFCYLLAADTFAHGRLTNPTHPLWKHFETAGVLWKPTYTSRFYPAQGLVLAAGQVLAGHPFWGVWFSVGLMCAALCWMLQGWMPPGWALLGGVLSVMSCLTWGSYPLATFSYWDNSYWGGAVAAIGGALVLGALPRMMKKVSDARRQVSGQTPGARGALQAPVQRHCMCNTLLMGLGLAVLANSRPYEGLFFGLGVAIALSLWLAGKNRPPWRISLNRVVAPLLVALMLTGASMGYYFWRVTGSPFHIPYLLYARAYDIVPNFPWEPLKPIPKFHHAEMQSLFLGEMVSLYRFAREHPGILAYRKAMNLIGFFLGPLLLMPIAALVFAVRGKFFRGLMRPGKARSLLLLCALPLVGMALPVPFFPHYAAPLTAALCALPLMAMRHLRLWRWRSQPVGRQIVRAVPVLAVAILVWHTVAMVRRPELFPPSRDFGRAAILTQLQSYPGDQLVIVQYGPDPKNDWVFNDAEIDAAKVVWARDLGASANQELIRYFKYRRVWLLEADDSPPKLLPYNPAETVGSRLNTTGEKQ